jgi:hypothetical protein
VSFKRNYPASNGSALVLGKSAQKTRELAHHPDVGGEYALYMMILKAEAARNRLFRGLMPRQTLTAKP